MPLAAIWAAAKTGGFWLKLLPYVLSFAAAFGLIYAAYSWSYARGSHSRDTEVANLRTNIDTLTANLRGAQDSLAQQERAILAVQAAGNAKVAEGNANYAKAQKANQTLVERNAALAKSVAKRPGANDPCTTSGTLQGMVI